MKKCWRWWRGDKRAQAVLCSDKKNISAITQAKLLRVAIERWNPDRRF
jgi:hypothetical protein